MLMSWFYPGEAYGHEFLYSPRQESQLSEGSQITVMARKWLARSGGMMKQPNIAKSEMAAEFSPPFFEFAL
jgi:hypothetical protein